MQRLTVEKWTDWDKACRLTNRLVNHPSNPHYKALFDAVVMCNMKIGSHEHQNNMAPVFSDGSAFYTSLGQWSKIMAEIWNEVAGYEKYHYMDFTHDIDFIRDSERPV
ncbi:hypothetical protein [Desulfatibacillum aliphaticivorans]|uniref:hypothetical protein n=1 Tax=Desulfatibacillum aliphaticivorans TaxID=218208 RepID=UPI0009D7924A|nr:hypothetical protein [Desulfatibacillum aliphaticivorans]